MEKLNRRNLMKDIGVLSVTMPVVSVGTAASSTTQSQGAEPKGIETAVSNHLKTGNIEDAISLLEQHEIEYDYAEVSMPTIDYEREQEGDFSIETWDKEESQLSHIAYHKSGDTYHSYLSWQLELLEHRACVDTTSPDDGVGLTVGDASWKPVLNSWEFGANTYLEDRGDMGVLAHFDDPGVPCYNGEPIPPSDDRLSSWMSVDWTKKRSGTHNIYGTYIHSWNKYGVPGGISFGLGYGPISVSSSSTSTSSWQKISDRNI